MSKYPQFIDNKRKLLSDTLREIANSHNTLSIATGYWDLAGTLEIINEIKDYQSIRLLIGKEPIAHRLQEKYKIDINSPENMFPDADIKKDLEKDYNIDEIDELRSTVRQLIKMMESGILTVKIFREPRLHAKAYIFGNLGDGNSVGIIGSSNFTRAGLTRNAELNFLTDDYKIVEFEPRTENQENGHLTWFNELWESEEATEWELDFTEILRDSPMGDYTFGAYDIYIRTLMELFRDELIETLPFEEDIRNVLHPFQEQNALSLRRKLKTLGVAMLSDSVGLGKTVTAAAIIKQYLLEGNNNILILPPAALKKQWSDELQSERWNLVENRDFQIISQQDYLSLDEMINHSVNRKFSKDEIDLFVVDEAHNLRNQGSIRYQQILKLFQENPNAHVLLLTATPINNSLMDFANQIQLGSKGALASKKVPYINKRGNKIEYIDFFEALKRIQTEASKAEKRGDSFDWEYYKNTLISGLRHYLVRSTRQGVEKRNAIKFEKGQKKLFPKSVVNQFTYRYSPQDEEYICNEIENKYMEIFEDINPLDLNLDLMEQITQRSMHPLDILSKIKYMDLDSETLLHKFGVNTDKQIEIYENNSSTKTIIPTIYKIINFLGFTVYKPDVYLHNIYAKDIDYIRQININSKDAQKVRIQLSIHNMLHVTWLKRLESSTATLLKSVRNYTERMKLFKKWLENGYIVSLSDASLLAKEYDEDIEKAFDDYEKYLIDISKAMEEGNEGEIKRKGIERKEANAEIYNIEQIYKDIERDLKICEVLEGLLEYLSDNKRDGKLLSFKNEILKQLKSQKYGKKILIFSFFSDTVEHLSQCLPNLINDDIRNFEKQSSFITGSSRQVEEVTKLFSPKSKKYKLKKNETEINFLFATDVLSEGQNLQDAGILINYDLHWNPVRMIQRNGRINRMGSLFDEILILNARPHEELEFYLQLVRRLERKITTINNTVGNDQSVLGEVENPIEFNDFIKLKDLYSINSEVATTTFNEIEKQDQILDWIDNYSTELRVFLDNPENKYKIKQILSIPIGKWNYLPEKDKRKNLNPTVIGLYKAQGQLVTNEEDVYDIGFVKIYESNLNRGPFSSIKSEYIQEQDALELIKTGPEDNTRLVDNISLNRKEYIKKGITEISVQFETAKSIYEVKPAGVRALEILANYYEENLLKIIENGIKRSNEKREFQKIVVDINKQVKEFGTPYNSTINRFRKFLDSLIEKEAFDLKLEKIEGVLYYVEK